MILKTIETPHFVVDWHICNKMESGFLISSSFFPGGLPVVGDLPLFTLTKLFPFLEILLKNKVGVQYVHTSAEVSIILRIGRTS